MTPRYQHIIIIPVYDDWQSLSQTIKGIRKTFAGLDLADPFLLVVNDGSTLIPDKAIFRDIKNNMKILHLHRNLGHQKAIAIGLAYIDEKYEFEKVVIMDADGEDDPKNITDLLSASAQFPDTIILARRTHRKEGLMFQLFYRFYKLFFYVLTGKKMAYGNFCLMTAIHADQLIHYSEIWNSVAGGIVKSGLAYTSVPIPKGSRHEGKSKMNLGSLIVHGLNTIAVFIETISVRILILSFIIIIISFLSIAAITIVKLFTPLAISGWASILASSMLVILLQSFLISLVMIVIFLSSQSQRKLIPAYHYTDYLRDSETIPNE